MIDDTPEVLIDAGYIEESPLPPQRRRIQQSQQQQTQQPQPVSRQRAHVQQQAKQAEEPKKEKKPSQQQTFSIKTLIHYLNSCYGERFLFKDAEKLKTLTDAQRKLKNVVDLHDFRALDEFKLCMRAQEDATRSEKVSEKVKWDTITHSIWDFKLRGILTAVNDNTLWAKEECGEAEKTYELLMTQLVPQLHFDQPYKFDQEEIKFAIISFLKGDRIKFNLFNKVFPHPDLPVKDGKQSTHLNKLYLQTLSKYHTKLLNALFRKDGVKDLDSLYRIVYESVLQDATDKGGVTLEYLENFKFDDDKSYKFDTPEEKVQKLPIIKIARTERNIAKKYFDYFQGCTDDRKSLMVLWDKYVNKIKEFHALADKIRAQDLRTNTIQDFVEMFLTVIKALNEPLKYEGSHNQFIKDIGFGKKLIFSQKFKQALTMALHGTDVQFSFDIGNEFRAHFIKNVKDKDGVEIEKEVDLEGEVIQETKYVPKTTYNTLSKIGLFVEPKGRRIGRKDIKTGIGIAIVDFVRTQSEKFLSKKPGKHARKVIYLK